MDKRTIARHGRTLLCVALLMATVGCDRITKHLASVALDGELPRSYVSGVVRLEYAENTGAFLSIGASLPESTRTLLLEFGVGLLLLTIAVVAFKYQLRGRALLGVTLIWAGGASNLFDRIVRGSVVDFINVGVGGLRTGIFNVADVAIFLGVVLFATARSADSPKVDSTGRSETAP
jgi:signal peptidase II